MQSKKHFLFDNKIQILQLHAHLEPKYESLYVRSLTNLRYEIQNRFIIVASKYAEVPRPNIV